MYLALATWNGMNPFILKTLPNGIRVLFVPMKNNPTVTVLVLTATGSHYETKEINGISHFLEHLCFKGTLRRPSAKIIAEELDGIGAHSNAFTGEEYTGYYVKASAQHAKKIFDVVADIFLHSTFPEEEINKERGVVIGEIDMYEDEPHSVVWDELGALMYGDLPAGWTILGPRENIKRLERSDFLAYREKNYSALSTLVVVAGNFNEEEIFSDTKKFFGDLEHSAKPHKKSTKEFQKNPEARVRYRDTAQTHFVLGFRGIAQKDPRRAHLKVLSGILGTGMSSRLFIKIREELGLGYYVGSLVRSFSDVGQFALYAGVSNDRIEEAIHAMLGEVRLLKRDGVSSGELRKVKEMLIGGMKLSLERSNDLASFYGFQEIADLEIHTPEEEAQEIKKVTDEDVLHLANELFVGENLNLALVGPRKSEEKLLEYLLV